GGAGMVSCLGDGERGEVAVTALLGLPRAPIVVEHPAAHHHDDQHRGADDVEPVFPPQPLHALAAEILVDFAEDVRHRPRTAPEKPPPRAAAPAPFGYVPVRNVANAPRRTPGVPRAPAC